MAIRITEDEPVKKKVVGTQVSTELYDKLKQEAQDGFMSVSDLLRKLIITYFRRKEEEGIND